MGKVFDWVDSRFGVKQPHRKFLERPIPQEVNYFFCLGGASFIFFLMLFLTGIMLSMYYVPSEMEAFRSIVRINNDIMFGCFIRSFHKWSANLLIVTIILHTMRVFVYKAYRPPRELNWIAGSLTLVIAFASGFTGYLLPWDQKAYWATEVGTSMALTVPLIGKYLLYLARGGEDVTGATLVRFYSLHILYFPTIMFLLLWAHFHMIRKQGVKGGL